MTRSNLQIANELPEPHLTKKSKQGKSPTKFYSGDIEGVQFVRSVHWWAEWKSNVDPFPIAAGSLYCRLTNPRWTTKEALNAWCGETIKRYSDRVNGVPIKKIMPKNDIYMKFATMALI